VSRLGNARDVLADWTPVLKHANTVEVRVLGIILLQSLERGQRIGPFAILGHSLSMLHLKDDEHWASFADRMTDQIHRNRPVAT
jgi:hypothetical protein